MGSLCGQQKLQHHTKDYLVVSSPPRNIQKIHTEQTLETTQNSIKPRKIDQNKKRDLNVINSSEKSTITSLNNSKADLVLSKEDQLSNKTVERRISEDRGGTNSEKGKSPEVKHIKIKQVQSSEFVQNLNKHRKTKSEMKYKQILVGLKNSPSLNNCFLNSILQCLFHTKELTQYFLNNEYLKEINKANKLKGALADSYGKLVKLASCSADFTIINPREIKILVGHFAPQFMNQEQQDCQEFLRFLLDALHDDLNRIKIKPVYKQLEQTSLDLTKTASK